MSEDFPVGEPHVDPNAERDADAAPAPTGNPRVDQVLETLHALDDAPVDEHVAVFDQAHDRLRAVLEDAGGDGARG